MVVWPHATMRCQPIYFVWLQTWTIALHQITTHSYNVYNALYVNPFAIYVIVLKLVTARIFSIMLLHNFYVGIVRIGLS